MTVKDFIENIEQQPIEVDELLNVEIKIRTTRSSGQYSQVVSPKKVSLEKILPYEKEVVLISTGVSV